MPNSDNIELSQSRVQTVASSYGADWSRWWAILQKLGPALQEIIMILIEQNQSLPMIARSGSIGSFDIDHSEIVPVAATYSLDPNELMSLLQSVTPLIARLILAFLSNNTIKTMSPPNGAK